MLIDCSARQGENDSQPAALQRRSGQGARQRGCDGNRRIERVIGSIRLASSAIISCTRALSRRTHRLKMALQMQPPSQQACTPSPRFLFQVGCHRRDATHTVSCYDNDCAASRWAGAACLVSSCLVSCCAGAAQLIHPAPMSWRRSSSSSSRSRHACPDLPVATQADDGGPIKALAKLLAFGVDGSVSLMSVEQATSNKRNQENEDDQARKIREAI